MLDLSFGANLQLQQLMEMQSRSYIVLVNINENRIESIARKRLRLLIVFNFLLKITLCEMKYI